MMHWVCVVSLSMAGITFALFVIAALVQLFRRPAPLVRPTPGGGIGAGVQQQALIEDMAKLVEALGKLADSLTKAGPTVVAFTATLAFLLVAMAAAGFETVKTPAPPPSPVNSGWNSATPCVLYAFRPGDHHLPGGVGSLEQSPADCFKTLMHGMEQHQVALLLIVGHADKRELLPKGRSYYGSNGSLAYQRALEVKKELLKAYTAGPKRPLSSEELSWRTIVLSAGPNNVGKEVTPDDLSYDRAVEIFPISKPASSPPG